MALAASLCALLALGLPACASEPQLPLTQAPLAQLEKRVSEAVNAHRRARGLAPLAWSDPVAAEARGHSSAMARGNTGFGHAGFELRVKRIAARLPLRSAAENIYRSTLSGDVVPVVMQRWLDSPVHRRNLEGNFDTAGVGAVRSAQGELFVTQIYVARRPASSRSGPVLGRALLHPLHGLLLGALRPLVVGLRALDGELALSGLGPTRALALGRALACEGHARGEQGDCDAERLHGRPSLDDTG